MPHLVSIKENESLDIEAIGDSYSYIIRSNNDDDVHKVYSYREDFEKNKNKKKKKKKKKTINQRKGISTFHKIFDVLKKNYKFKNNT